MTAIHRHHLLRYKWLPVYKRTYINTLGCTQGPRKSLNYVARPITITVSSFPRIFQWQAALLQIQNDTRSEFLLDSCSVTCLQCFIYFFILQLDTIQNFRGPRGRRSQQGNNKTEIRQYAERNEMKLCTRLIQYLCVIWDYSGTEDSHGYQIKKRKKTQCSDTNLIWDKRRKWWKNHGDRDLWTWFDVMMHSNMEWWRATSVQHNLPQTQGSSLWSWYIRTE